MAETLWRNKCHMKANNHNASFRETLSNPECCNNWFLPPCSKARPSWLHSTIASLSSIQRQWAKASKIHEQEVRYGVCEVCTRRHTCSSSYFNTRWPYPPLAMPITSSSTWASIKIYFPHKLLQDYTKTCTWACTVRLGRHCLQLTTCWRQSSEEDNPVRALT